MYHINKDIRSINSCELIFNGLHQLMKEKEFAKITVSELVNKAQIGRTTFYRNFDAIEDVIVYKLNDHFKKLSEYLKEQENKNIEYYIKPFLEYWESNAYMIEMLIESKQISILNKEFEKLMESFVVKNPRIYEFNMEYKDYIISIRGSVIISLLIQWIKRGKKETPEMLTDMLIQHKKNIDELGYLF